MAGCIMYTGIRLLLLLFIPLFFFYFFFLSNFETLNVFVILFSGTVRPRRLKLVTHMDNQWMYHMYQNQAAAAYSSHYFSFFFLSYFQTLKFFITLFSGTVRPRRLKLATHVDNWWMYRVYRNQAAAALIHPFVFLFLFLSNFETLKIFVILFSGIVRPRRLKLVTHVDNGWIYHVYQNQAAAAYSSLYFFIFLSSFQIFKFFCHTFLRNCEA